MKDFRAKTGKHRLLESLADVSDGISRFQFHRMIFGGLVVLILLTYQLWRLMLPFWLLTVAVAVYLRFSRPKDSL
jgi:MFS superfamily sulfate permease-like transporter